MAGGLGFPFSFIVDQNINNITTGPTVYGFFSGDKKTSEGPTIYTSGDYTPVPTPPFTDSSIIASGFNDFTLPQWGRCFWQDANDGELFVAFARDSGMVQYATSTDNGKNWERPRDLFCVDNFAIHNNFDTMMDRRGNIHCVYRYNGDNNYKFVRKLGGGGWSAGGDMPFQTAGDSGVVAGCQASLTIREADPFGFGGTPGPHPSVVIASKASGDAIEVYTLSEPFNGTPALFGDAGFAGEDGGYPVMASNYTLGIPAIFYYDASTNTIDEYTIFFSPFESNTTVVGSGLNPFGDNMCFGSGCHEETDGWVIVCGPSGQDFWGTTDGGLFGGGRDYRHVTAISANNNIPWLDAFPTGLFDVTPQGTNCDISFGNVQNEIFMYFQAYAPDGSQCINRFKGKYRAGNGIAQTGLYDWPRLNAAGSGVNYFAIVDRTLAGGVSNKAHWRKFKALKHPSSPGDGVTKQEMVITSSFMPQQSFIWNPSGLQVTAIKSWNITSSVADSDNLPFPSFSQNLTDSASFSGVLDTNGFIGGATGILDNSILTGDYLSSAGAYITFAFTDAVNVTDIEIWKKPQASGWGLVSVSGAQDDAGTYLRLFASDSGLVSQDVAVITSNKPVAQGDNNTVGIMDASLMVKYLRINWEGNGNSSVIINNIRLHGPGSTLRPIKAPYDNRTIYSEVPWQPRGAVATEEFHLRQDSIPPGWLLTRDFPWGVDASGSFRQTSFLPSVDPSTFPENSVQSGTFAGQTHGRSDSFALVSRPTNQAGDVGAIEVNIEVLPGETRLSDPSIQGRDISFSYRSDMHPNDVFQFDVITSGSVANKLTLGPGASPQSYTQFQTFAFGPGTHTARWVHTRGSGSSPNRTGEIWVDRVIGLNGSPQPSIRGFMQGSSFVASGSIHGFINGRGFTFIHGYIAGSGWNSNILGYTKSQVFPDAVGSIHGYMLGETSSKIHGFAFGASGIVLKTFPTGSIGGYVGGAKMYSVSSIHGYLLGITADSIHGYLDGFIEATGTSSVHGYMLAKKPFGAIHGLVNGSGDFTVMSGIHGYMKGFQGDQFIHGYIKLESGVFSNIHGYTSGPTPDQFIYGFLPQAFENPSGSIHGYMLANKPFSAIHGFVFNSGSFESIHGFMKGEIGDQFIYGYLKRPPAAMSSIHGYVQAAMIPTGVIHGYIEGAELASGVIHGFTSGVGFSSSVINGYMAGISGSITGAIHGYILGEEAASGTINGFLIGFTASGVDLCEPNHNFPLPPVNSGTIPSGFICNVLA